MWHFLEFLRNLFVAHIFEHFQDLPKTLFRAFQIFLKFRQISTQFLCTCSFSKVNLTFPHNSSAKCFYFLRSYSKVAKFIRKIHKISIEIFFKCVQRVSKIFSIIFLVSKIFSIISLSGCGYFFNFPKMLNS